jgi:hypothetical protein
VPRDEPTQDIGSTSSEEQRSAQPATPGEAPADAEHSASPLESATPASGNGNVRPESAEKDEPNGESDSTAQKESGQSETDTRYAAYLLALEPRDAQANIDTQLPTLVGITIFQFRSADVRVRPFSRRNPLNRWTADLQLITDGVLKLTRSTTKFEFKFGPWVISAT